MKLTIIPSDKTVILDGVPEEVDCSGLSAHIHAIQWNGSKGHIEFVPDGAGNRISNLPIDSIAPYQYLAERWNAARHARAAAVAEQERMARIEAENRAKEAEKNATEDRARAARDGKKTRRIT